MKEQTKALLLKLEKETEKAQKEKAEAQANRLEEKENLRLEKVRLKAKKLFTEKVTEEKLLNVARMGVNKYPILLIVEGSSSNLRPVKKKKDGYRSTIGELGGFLFDELVDNGFTPVIIMIFKFQLESEKNHNPDWVRPYSDDVKVEGYYLGIQWGE